MSATTITRGFSGKSSSFKNTRIDSARRLAVESLENRLALATVALPLDVTDINVTDSGGLEAVISLAGQAIDTVPIDMTTTAAPADAPDDCPILNLHVGEIHLNLLGLQVDTSEICLDVSATDDEGLLGSLLCDLTGDIGLGGILDQLDDVLGRVEIFLGRIEDLLDEVLLQAFTVTDVLAEDVAAQQTEHVCDILNLSLGPIDLDVPLLGVNVHLDNCADGPVTVDITANEEGGLLGQILCGVAGGLDSSQLNVDRLIDQIDRLVDRLLALADRLDDLPASTPNIRNLTRQLNQFADKADSLKDVEHLLGKVEGLGRHVDRALARLI